MVKKKKPRELRVRMNPELGNKLLLACENYGNGIAIANLLNIHYNTLAMILKSGLATPTLSKRIKSLL